MQQRALVGVVEVGGIGERAVGERGQRRVGATAARAPDGGNGRRLKRRREIAHDAALVGVIGPGAERAADRIEDHVAGRPHDRLGQMLEGEAGGEGAEGFGRTGGYRQTNYVGLGHAEIIRGEVPLYAPVRPRPADPCKRP